MTFNEYQEKMKATAIYPGKGENLVYPTLGLVGEAGEVAEKIKKLWREKNNQADENDKKEIAKELGDVLWYLSQLSNELDLKLDDIAQINIDKIYSRLERNVLYGSGDNR